MDQEIILRIVFVLVGILFCYLCIRSIKFGFYINVLWVWSIGAWIYRKEGLVTFLEHCLWVLVPVTFANLMLYVFIEPKKWSNQNELKYKAEFQVKGTKIVLENIRRGVSIIGSAGSGKTESVVYNFLMHFHQHGFSGVIHDYKHFEITEIAHPIFKKGSIPFDIISFGPFYGRVNPIAPRYIESREYVHEIARVLLENLLELRDSNSGGSAHFFNNAVQGLIAGMIWRLKTEYPKYCTIPHMIALFQRLPNKSLVEFLSADMQSKAMADAFIRGVGSERQTAGVLSTLGNAFSKITTPAIFFTLSKDEIDLDINTGKEHGVIAIVNNPKEETSLSPIIATIIHAITKQMSVRGGNPSFLMMEEAPTLRLPNMHRIPATLRSYDISTVYVMQDKVQNDMMYGEMASRSILSNLSYQFFGKANDPETAKYYERFFEVVKKPTKSVNTGYSLNFDTRVTQGEKDVAKTRADAFFGLQQGEFVVFFDGKDKRVRFKTPKMEKFLPKALEVSIDQLEAHFAGIYMEIKEVLKT